MTRNEYIAECAWERAMQLPDHNVKEAISFAVEIADKLESEGCAPWQDAPPPAVELDGIDTHPIQFGLPTRREITAADVQPGAVFVDDDGETYKIIEVMHIAGTVRFQVDGNYTSWQLDSFLSARNRHNATVTPPTA